MDLMKKLSLLTEGAKYDAACTSSGSSRDAVKGVLGNTTKGGCCHSFSADGRCISLLKVLLTNHCIYDCKYCVNRRSNDIERTAFTPDELAEITIQFYRRNYIEGLFLSSGVIRSPDHTMELLIKTLELIRYKHGFWGYIHAKTIPGADPALIHRLGLVADRLSVNIELPSEQSLSLLAPHKSKKAILTSMGQISDGVRESGSDMIKYSAASEMKFSSAGQATQMIIGASPETDYQIIRLSSGLYKKFNLKRVFYSAYIAKNEDSALPAPLSSPPLLREHRLYQADFLMRFYKFSYNEILDERCQSFNPYIDPKANWAINNFHHFPVDVNKADKNTLLRVPGIGPRGAEKILEARRFTQLTTEDLRRMGIVLKRAQFFLITADNKKGARFSKDTALRALIDPTIYSFGTEQLTFFDAPGLPGAEDVKSIAEAAEEAVLCLSKAL